MKLTQQELKKMAAIKALEYVPDNEYIGIGTGSTTNEFIKALGKSGIKVKGAVSTSEQTSQLLAEFEIPEISLKEISKLAVYIDGADEVNHSLQMIKGGGGALLMEKIVSNHADKFICIADESKYVSKLGSFPLPIEVIPFARSMVARQLVVLGGQVDLRIGFTTFSGNQILDVKYLDLSQPLKMEDKINEIVGVVDNGIFARKAANILVLGKQDGCEVIKIN